MSRIILVLRFQKLEYPIIFLNILFSSSMFFKKMVKLSTFLKII